MAPKQLSKDDTKLPEGITKGYARWVIDEWKNVVTQMPPTGKELDAMDKLPDELR